MREIRAIDAAARLSRLLDEVEQGESVVITRDGRRVARIIPDKERRQEEIDAAISSMKRVAREIQEQHGRMTVEKILSLRHEGHKY